MKVIETRLPDLLLIEPRLYADDRGFFLETFNQARYREAGIARPFVQDNHSYSRHGVLRGLHFQRLHPQGKLVWVTQGEVYDVAVDLRPGSPTYGQWEGITMSEQDHRQLWVPPGFAHGYCVLSSAAGFVYKCTDFYHPADEGGIVWNDPDIGIPWPIAAPVLSDKDRLLPRLRDLTTDLLPHITPG
jgi:dTDP-4-dehydrorhamnose 3,5-epimerase